MDDAEADMMAMAYRVEVSQGVDTMFETIGRDKLVKKDDNGDSYVHTDILLSLAAQMSIDGHEAVVRSDYSYAEAMAKCATVINVLALRANGEEPNVFEDQFLD